MHSKNRNVSCCVSALASHLKYEPLKIKNVSAILYVYLHKLEATTFTLLSQGDVTHDTMLAGYLCQTFSHIID
jgi:hypothetical protein